MKLSVCRLLCLTLVMLCGIHLIHCAQRTKKIKKPKEDIKSVSSDKVKNGGNKGPMSGVGSLPNPFQIPLPLIPKKKQNNLSEKPHSKKKNGPLSGLKSKQGTKKKSKSRNNEDDVSKEEKKSVVQGGQDVVFTPLDHTEVLQRMRRNNIEDDVLTDEERKLRDEWLKFDAISNIPNKEVASLIPTDLSFIWEGKDSLTDAYDTVIPHVKERLQKRSVSEDESEDDEEDKENNQQDTKPSSTDNNEDDLMIMNKRSVTDYDLSAEEEEEDEEINQLKSDMPRDIRTRDVDEAENFEESVLDIVDGDNEADFLEPIQHHIATRETIPRDGRSVRFE